MRKVALAEQFRLRRLEEQQEVDDEEEVEDMDVD